MFHSELASLHTTRKGSNVKVENSASEATGLISSLLLPSVDNWW